MENLPGPGIEPMSSALAGGCLTPGPPGKSWQEDLERGGQPRLSLKVITGIPIRWKQRKSHLEKTRRQRDIRGSDQSDVATSQGSQGLLTTTKSWKRQKGSSPRASRRSVTCQYFGCRILDSGTLKEYIFVVFATNFVVFCYSSHRKLWVLPKSKFRHEFQVTWLTEWLNFIICCSLDLPRLILCRPMWICSPSVLVADVDTPCLPKWTDQAAATLMALCELFIQTQGTQTQWKDFRESFKVEVVLTNHLPPSVCLESCLHHLILLSK